MDVRKVKPVVTDPNLRLLFAGVYGERCASWELKPTMCPQMVRQTFAEINPEITALLIWRYNLKHIARLLKIQLPRVSDSIAPVLYREANKAVRELYKTGKLATLVCAVKQ